MNLTLKHTKRENGIVKTTSSHDKTVSILPQVLFSSTTCSAEKKKTIAIRQIKYLLKSDSLSLQEHEKFVEEKLCKNVYFTNLLLDVMVTMLFIFLKCKRPRLRYFGITKNR